MDSQEILVPDFKSLIKEDMRSSGIKRISLLSLIRYAVISPGFLTILLMRIAHWGKLKQSKFGFAVSKVFWRLNIFFNSCHIDPEAVIGPGVDMPHPSGIVIGKGTVIGSNALILQNVTFGSAHSKASVGTALYPKVGNNVKIYAGAVILGDIRIGNNSVIGANAVVTHDVPDDMVAVGIPARVRPLAVGS